MILIIRPIYSVFLRDNNRGQRLLLLLSLLLSFLSLVASKLLTQ